VIVYVMVNATHVMVYVLFCMYDMRIDIRS
jgi:hypothetical protein